MIKHEQAPATAEFYNELTNKYKKDLKHIGFGASVEYEESEDKHVG